MKNLVIVNAIDISEYGLKELAKGESSFDLVIRYAAALPDAEEVLVLCRPDFPHAASVEYRTAAASEWSVPSLLECMARESAGFDHVYYCHGDTPFLDSGKTDEMYQKHIKYYIQYSFADGYPVGLTPEILRADCLGMIAQQSRDITGDIKRDSIFEAIKIDINAFDIETDIAPKDQRLLRVTLAADTKRNFVLLRDVAAAAPSSAQEVCDYLDNTPEKLRTLPAYFLFQVCGGCPQACTYCPWAAAGGDVLSRKDEMDTEKFLEAVSRVRDFSGDAAIGLSLWGEPSIHSDISGLISGVLGFDGLSCLVETSGIGWAPGVLKEISHAADERLEWIVSLDALDPVLYKQLRGDGYEEANQTALELLELAPNRVHIQAVRMKESEELLQEFYRHWKQHTDNIIIQKYNSFSGTLPERKVTDLSPLKRHPCWHLKRDVHVLLDGSVPVCKEDIHGTNLLGNIFEDSLEDIWDRGNEWYLKHLSEDYPDICKGCDEYYTYNF